MGVIFSVARRKANRFNIENRAFRFLDKDEPKPAPKYEANIRDLKRSMEEDPNFLERESKKDSALDDRLKRVYVTSQEGAIDYRNRRGTDIDRPLPSEKGIVEDFEYGFKEPDKVPIGKCTLRQALTFITNHMDNSEEWSAQRISKEYRLHQNTVENILAHFKTFQIYIPDIHKKERTLAQRASGFIRGKTSDEKDSSGTTT